MTFYRKKPVVVEAIQWTGNWDEIKDFVGDSAEVLETFHRVEISTLEGVMVANKGDWIIKGVKGEFYPCRADIFAETYELAEASI